MGAGRQEDDGCASRSDFRLATSRHVYNSPHPSAAPHARHHDQHAEDCWADFWPQIQHGSWAAAEPPPPLQALAGPQQQLPAARGLPPTPTALLPDASASAAAAAPSERELRKIVQNRNSAALSREKRLRYAADLEQQVGGVAVCIVRTDACVCCRCPSEAATEIQGLVPGLVGAFD